MDTNFIISNVRELKTGFIYCYDLERVFIGCPKRNYKITGILESRLEGAK